MFRILAMLTYFFRELIFDSKEEYSVTSRMFNVKKVLLFIILTSSVMANGFFIWRIYVLAVENKDLKTKVVQHEKINGTLSSDSSKTANIAELTKKK